MHPLKLAAGAAAALALSAVSAHAGAVNWTLHNVVFDDGGTASGTFSTDSVTGDLTVYDITTTDGATLTGFHYTSGDSFVLENFYAPMSFIVQHGLTQYLNFAFQNPLTGPGVNPLLTGPILPLGAGNTASGLVFGSSWECANCSNIRTLESGFAIGSAPEPAAWGLMVLGFAGLGGLVRIARKPAAAEA